MKLSITSIQSILIKRTIFSSVRGFVLFRSWTSSFHSQEWRMTNDIDSLSLINCLISVFYFRFLITFRAERKTKPIWWSPCHAAPTWHRFHFSTAVRLWIDCAILIVNYVQCMDLIAATHESRKRKKKRKSAATRIVWTLVQKCFWVWCLINWSSQIESSGCKFTW